MSAPHLQLTKKQHEQLAKALATAHKIHSMVTGGALGDPNLGHDPMALAGILDTPIYVKGGAHGGGWWSDLGSTLKKGVKELQSSDTVRALTCVSSGVYGPPRGQNKPKNPSVGITANPTHIGASTVGDTQTPSNLGEFDCITLLGLVNVRVGVACKYMGAL